VFVDEPLWLDLDYLLRPLHLVTREPHAPDIGRPDLSLGPVTSENVARGMKSGQFDMSQ
jgi:hypothetical protein